MHRKSIVSGTGKCSKSIDLLDNGSWLAKSSKLIDLLDNGVLARKSSKLMDLGDNGFLGQLVLETIVTILSRACPHCETALERTESASNGFGPLRRPITHGHTWEAVRDVSAGQRGVTCQ